MNRIAFITGGNGCIGTAIVEELLKEDYTVLYTYNKNPPDPEHLKQTHSSLKAFKCDLLNPSEVNHVSEVVLNQYSKVDVLINNAGIMSDSTFVKMNREQWEIVIDVNLKSLFGFTHSFIPTMIEQNYGRVINIASIAGVKGFWGKTNYSAAKAGVIGFTRSLAIEVAKNGITVNAVCPGVIKTKMSEQIPIKYMNSILERIPVGRLGSTNEVAATVAFLASQYSSYITGEVISVSGGF
jgi:NAD(P)-dependent dehydrogenase (short-subunit alcohol dehydrogenase family)